MFACMYVPQATGSVVCVCQVTNKQSDSDAKKEQRDARRLGDEKWRVKSKAIESWSKARKVAPTLVFGPGTVARD